MIKFSKMKQIELFCMFFGEKMFLLRAAKNLKLKCTTKRSPIAGLGVQTGEISFRSKNSFSVLRQINLQTCVFSKRNFPSPYTQSCNRRPFCSTLKFENFCSHKKKQFYFKKKFNKSSNFSYLKILLCNFLLQML